MLPMLNALRLVWAISAHYSDDTRMAALLQRIAHSVCDRAQHSVSTQARSCLGIPPFLPLNSTCGFTFTTGSRQGLNSLAWIWLSQRLPW